MDTKIEKKEPKSKIAIKVKNAEGVKEIEFWSYFDEVTAKKGWLGIAVSTFATQTTLENISSVSLVSVKPIIEKGGERDDPNS